MNIVCDIICSAIIMSKASEMRCANCPMRAKYDKAPKSLGGRIWRWHINFCPGWKGYLAAMDEEERKAVCEPELFMIIQE